jgi:GGDEF domain-containing protein/CRP-like cAMP-binding protein
MSSEMFVSLKRYLENRPEQVIGALCQMVRQLLHAIGQHSVRADAGDHERFRQAITEMARQFETPPPAAEVPRLAGEAVSALGEYNARAQKCFRAQTSELQSIVEMMTKTMTAIASGAEHSISRLREIETHLQNATAVEDFQTAKIRMSECLNTLRFEIEHRRQESAVQVQELRSAIHRSERRASGADRPPGKRDPVTDLPDRPEAEAAVVEEAEGRRPFFVAVFVLERIELINMRFGHAAGDQVLVAYRQHLADHLESGDRMFRWTGPALVALLDRAEPIAAVRESVGRFASKRLAKSAVFGTRSVLLPVEAKWAVLSPADAHSPATLIRQLDAFVENAGVRVRATG